MKSIDYVVSLYFHNVSAYNIFHDNIRYKSFDENEFKRLMFTALPNISESETEEICAYLSTYGEGNGTENGLNVFRALKEVSAEFLEICKNQPICRYEKLIKWKNLVESTGEDMLICAFLAKNTEKTGRAWNNFIWNPVIGHDNVQLNRIMQRGLSDNHFHLFGSAPSFKLIWLRLMNDFTQEAYVQSLQKMDEDQRQVGKNYSNSYREETLVRLRFKAGLIRAYLISYIEKAEKGVLEEADETKRIDEAGIQKKIQCILESEYDYFEYYAELQNYIDGVKLADLTRYRNLIDDYASRMDYEDELNQEFAGERKFMYQMLLGKINGQRIPDKLMNWFYAYLVIQVKFRGELVQANENVGFENFNRYSRRKSGFLNKQTDTERMIRHAVGGSLKSGNIRSLELRITPANTAEENRAAIERCNFYIRKKIGETAFNATYYVFHFPKRKDRELSAEQIGYIGYCRHYEFRENLEMQADQIVEFRERYPEIAKRVLGIDACAQELYCRPEVFAPAFRMLSGHVVHNVCGEDVGQLRITYHVGEDWYDIVDGLRAIDETITFLGMRNGDRLGHATVLGINIQDWYEKKNNNIWVSRQNYLDNVVWLYHKLIEFDIRDSEALKGFLLSEYDRYFRELYGDTIQEDIFSCSIDTYYFSWKLRGDHPQLYAAGKFEMPYFYRTAYMVNECLEDGTSFRQDKEAVRLMHYYHYSATIRNKGKTPICKMVSDIYIKGVQKVQKAMQSYVSQCGISIETNPSSNYKISTIDRYEKHPILDFYNIGLTWNDTKIKECPQLHASINTDDKGIFETSLENEFALISCAVENMKDDCGEKLYHKQMVYDWLDRIRQNGNQQSFLDII